MTSIHCILHPTDFSDHSAAALRVALSLAQDYAARLLVVHVQAPAIVFSEPYVLPPDPAETRRALQERLTALAPGAHAFPVDRLLVEGEPAGEILRLAGERGCSLIVMGTHGRTGMGRLLLGSVAETVLRHAPCPVLTVKSVPVEPKKRPPVVRRKARA